MRIPFQVEDRADLHFFLIFFFFKGNKQADLHIHFQEVSCGITCGQRRFFKAQRLHLESIQNG